MSTTTPATGDRAGPNHPRPAELPPGPTRGTLTERMRHGIAETVRNVRFITDRPPCLIEHLNYARRGEWSEEREGPARLLAEVYAWLVAMPISVVAYLIAWCAARPGRVLTALGLWVAIASALARVPFVGAIIPSWSHW